MLIQYLKSHEADWRKVIEATEEVTRAHEVMESRLKLDEAKEDLWYHGKMWVRCWGFSLHPHRQALRLGAQSVAKRKQSGLLGGYSISVSDPCHVSCPTWSLDTMLSWLCKTVQPGEDHRSEWDPLISRWRMLSQGRWRDLPQISPGVGLVF